MVGGKDVAVPRAVTVYDTGRVESSDVNLIYGFSVAAMTFYCWSSSERNIGLHGCLGSCKHATHIGSLAQPIDEAQKEIVTLSVEAFHRERPSQFRNFDLFHEVQRNWIAEFSVVHSSNCGPTR